jgi:hypothetical protein
MAIDAITRQEGVGLKSCGVCGVESGAEEEE